MNHKIIKRAINSLKSKLCMRFGNEVEIFLFGSAARNDYNRESDIDILVLFPGKVDTRLEEEVFSLAYDIELEQDVVFGINVHSKEYWNSEKAAVMPFYQNVQREGMRV
ncbi:MAG: nucleotidyltransferase domain-containing protein [Candidatus Aminicenantes bacterium]|nr:nucleotidyltransferase domain-containing protein [Candidatus Aminicenantes bacterium]